jgi:hypothetical protein
VSQGTLNNARSTYLLLYSFLYPYLSFTAVQYLPAGSEAIALMFNESATLALCLFGAVVDKG